MGVGIPRSTAMAGKTAAGESSPALRVESAKAVWMASTPRNLKAERITHRARPSSCLPGADSRQAGDDVKGPAAEVEGPVGARVPRR